MTTALTLALGSAPGAGDGGDLRTQLKAIQDAINAGYAAIDAINAALGDGSFVTRDGAQTLTHKTLDPATAVSTLTRGDNAAHIASTAYVDGVTGGAGAVPFRNRLMNGQFRIDQTNLGAPTAVADNAYGPDRWRALCETSGNTTLTAGDTTIGGGRTNLAIKFTGTSDKGGVIQVIEGVNCKDWRGQDVAASAVIAVSNARLGNIKMAIVAFSGTEDATTGDPISSWGADGVNPTLAASWAYTNTPVNLSVGTAPAKYSVTGSIPANATNVAVLIWNDDKSYSANDTLYVTDTQIEAGKIATPFEARPLGYELMLCQRYCERVEFGANQELGSSTVASNPTPPTLVALRFPFNVKKRAVPTSIMGSAAANYFVAGAAATSLLYDGDKSAVVMRNIQASSGTVGSSWAAVNLSVGASGAFILARSEI